MDTRTKQEQKTMKGMGRVGGWGGGGGGLAEDGGGGGEGARENGRKMGKRKYSQ